MLLTARAASGGFKKDLATILSDATIAVAEKEKSSAKKLSNGLKVTRDGLDRFYSGSEIDNKQIHR